MLIDDRPVRAAEHAVTARKARLAAQRMELLAQAGARITQPSTLVAVAFVGGVLGWRSAGARAARQAKRVEPAAKPSVSFARGALRSLVLAALQAVASIASEEILRSTISRGNETAGSAAADPVDASQ